jgi:ribose transport system permease protein
MSRFLSHYGMVLVLVALAAFFSWATIAEQHPSGAEASEAIAPALPEGRILIVARPSQEDREFAQTLREVLPEATVFEGDPGQLRRALETGEVPDAIATTQGYAAVVSSIRQSLPALSDVSVLTPPSYTWPTFLLPENLLNVANQIAVIAIMAVGMTMVIITAGIDLSVGSLVALSAVLVAYLIGAAGGDQATGLAMIGCCLAAIALSAAVGGFSGFMITRFRLPPFIATLGMMQVASGFAYIISRGKPIYQVPDAFVWLGRGTTPIFSIPYAVILMILLYVGAHVVMSRTTFGRYIYAVGGNPEAARLSGVRVNRILLSVYVVSGAMAGLGGVVLASQLKGGAPTYGLMYELYVIACVVVGGTSLAGGEGKMMGTLIGAFIIAVIQNGMNLTNVESYTQKVILGFVILGAVLLDRLRRMGWRRRPGAGSAGA